MTNNQMITEGPEMPVFAVGGYEPYCTMQLYPACRGCGGVHPLARRPSMPGDKCPDCGMLTGGLPPSVTEKAVLTGYSIPVLTAKLCLAIGNWLFSKVRRNP